MSQNWFEKAQAELAERPSAAERRQRIDAIQVTPELEAYYPQFADWEEDKRHARIRELVYMEEEDKARNIRLRAETVARRRQELVDSMGSLAEALVDALGDPKTAGERDEKYEKVLEALRPLHERINRLGPHIIG